MKNAITAQLTNYLVLYNDSTTASQLIQLA